MIKNDKIEYITSTTSSSCIYGIDKNGNPSVEDGNDYKVYESEVFELNEKLITFGGKAYPKFGNAVLLAGGAGSGKGFVKETIIRKDSIQISKHGNHIDTLSIKWKNNFFYTLKYINPKTTLQKDPMFVQINKIHKESYDFTVKIGFSKFKKKATIYKVK